MNWNSVLPIIVAYMPAILVMLAGMWQNNKRIDDLRAEMHNLRTEMLRGFDSLEKLLTEKLLRVEGILDARLKSIEDHR